MEGLWTGQGQSEVVSQAQITRHRPLCVNVSATGWKNPIDISSYASLDPNAITAAPNWAIPEGGPHFIMSPDTPDDSKSYGFEWTISTTPMLASPDPASPLAGGYTVTWWEMIGVTTAPNGLFNTPLWSAMLPETGVAINTLYHCFDVNATVLRCQISNVTAAVNSGGSIMIFFAEL